MSKPYFVGIMLPAVVMAENEYHARQVAESCALEIASNQELEIPPGILIKSLEDLADYGDYWDSNSIPYNSDDCKPLGEIIPEKANEDNKTVNIFEQDNK